MPRLLQLRQPTIHRLQKLLVQPFAAVVEPRGLRLLIRQQAPLIQHEHPREHFFRWRGTPRQLHPRQHFLEFQHIHRHFRRTHPAIPAAHRHQTHCQFGGDFPQQRALTTNQRFERRIGAG